MKPKNKTLKSFAYHKVEIHINSSLLGSDQYGFVIADSFAQAINKYLNWLRKEDHTIDNPHINKITACGEIYCYGTTKGLIYRCEVTNNKYPGEHNQEFYILLPAKDKLNHVITLNDLALKLAQKTDKKSWALKNIEVIEIEKIGEIR